MQRSVDRHSHSCAGTLKPATPATNLRLCRTHYFLSAAGIAVRLALRQAVQPTRCCR